MIIETEDHRELLRTELFCFENAEQLAKMNRRYSIKSGVLIVQNAQIVCGNLASFRVTSYTDEWNFHPEYTVLDMYSSELDKLTMYVAKVNLKGEEIPSRPCVRCMKAIKKDAEEITHMVYRDQNLRIVKEEL
jgi:hypothetical protein